MNLKPEDYIKIRAIDNVSLETFKELAKADLVVDKLKGAENTTPGLMQELVMEVERLRSDNYQLQSELYQLSNDLGKLVRIIERQSMSLTSDYEFQQIKSRRPA